MAARRMHADEVEVDIALVRRLLASQFPAWADLPLEPVASAGTDNALFRLGCDMVVRLPRIHWAVGGVEKDERWLPLVAPRVPCEVPVPLARGMRGEGYDWDWGVYPWLEGENPIRGGIAHPDFVAADVARFVASLHAMDLADPPASFRGVQLAPRDEAVRAALAQLEGKIDTGAAAEAWEAALRAPEWPGPPIWIHGDLLPGNLLFRGGRLTGVIDWGGLGSGDPACDLIPAWSVLPREARSAFRAAVGADDAMWERGRGWALSIGLIALPYYEETNPGLAAVARVLIREVLADAAGT